MNTKITKRTDLTKVIDELNLKVGVEVGVRQGHFSEYILANSHIEKLYSVDAWMEEQDITLSVRKRCEKGKMDLWHQETINRLSKFGDRSIIIKDLSANAVNNFENESLDFIYLDASHIFSGFALDIIYWWDKLKWGGIYAGHDYWRKYRYSTAYVVNGFCMERKQLFLLTTDERKFPQYPPSWWLIKTQRNKDEFVKEFAKHKEIIKQQQKEMLENRRITIDIPYECF